MQLVSAKAEETPGVRMYLTDGVMPTFAVDGASNHANHQYKEGSMQTRPISAMQPWEPNRNGLENFVNWPPTHAAVRRYHKHAVDKHALDRLISLAVHSSISRKQQVRSKGDGLPYWRPFYGAHFAR